MEQRRTRRFTLQLPLSITRTGAARVALSGRTRNISSGGVLFTTEVDSDLSGGPIEYLITLNQEGTQTVTLRCIGKVMRFEREGEEHSGAAYQVAATLERYEFVRDR